MKTAARLASRVAAGAIVTALLSAPAPALSGDAMTLREAIAEALRGSDLLKAEQGRLAAAEGAVGAARSLLLPSVSVEERFLRTDNPAYDFSMKINQGAFTGADLQGAPASFNDPAPISDFQTTLTLSQPLYAPRARIGLAMAREESAAAALDHARRREEVAHAALQAWLGAKAAEAYEDAAVKAEEDAAEHVRLAKVAEDAGTGLASDTMRAAVALSEARRMRLAVDNNLEIARRGLGLALGRETAALPTADDLGGDLPALESLLDAVDRRTDLQAMGRRVENARRNVDLAKAERLPEIGLFGSLQANDPDLPFGTAGTSYSAGVGVTWRLSQWHSAAGERQAAGELQRAEGFRSGLAKEARFRVRESWLRWGEAKQSLAIAAEARGVAEEGVRLVRVRYENGLSTMVALLDAQAALNRARSDAARAAAELAAALGELRFRSGLLLDGIQTASSTAPPDDTTDGGRRP
jgi:outer membrane protein TolC